MIRFPDPDPTGSAIQNRIRIKIDYEKKSTGSYMDIQTAVSLQSNA